MNHRPSPQEREFNKHFNAALNDGMGHVGNRVAHAVESYPLQLGSLVALGGMFGVVVAAHGTPIAGGFVAAAVVLVALAIGPLRRAYVKAWRRGTARRRWNAAVEHAGIKGHVKAGNVEKIPVGHRMEIQLGKGAGYSDLDKKQDVLGAEIARLTGKPVRQLRFEECGPGRAIVTVVEHDLPAESTWPRIEAFEGVSAWEPIPFATDEFGHGVDLVLSGRHSLFAGETGSGKTVAQSMVVATAALDPTARLFILDPNEMLWQWEGVAEMYAVGNDNSEAEQMLQFILAEHARRNALRKKAELDKFTRELADETGEGMIVLAIDEAPEFLRVKALGDLLRRIAARTRVSATHVNLVMQSPNATIIDPTIRNNFGIRAAFRANSPSASQVILGSTVVDASTIAPDERGVCYLHQDGILPIRARTFYPTPDEIRGLAAAAARGRNVG